MRTERFRWVLNAVGSAAPKWFASGLKRQQSHINKQANIIY